MTFEDALYQIEDVSFLPKVCIASDLDTMLFLAGQQEAVRVLRSGVPNHRALLLKRILRLVDDVPNDEYRNPHDVALTIYVWLLHSADPRLSVYAADAIMKAPQCWWAWKAATAVLAEFGSQTASVSPQTQEETAYQEFGFPSARTRGAIQANDESTDLIPVVADSRLKRIQQIAGTV